MATRKSGDGSRDLTESAGDRPGTYVKVSSSRRKRKGKKGHSVPPSSPPSESAPPDSAEQSLDGGVLDAEGEEIERLESGQAGSAWDDDQDDNSVDDLRRRKPPSSPAARKPVGPLGMEDGRDETPPTPRSPLPPRRESPLPPAPASRINVVEINPSDDADHGSDPDNDNDVPEQRDQRGAESEDPFGDPFPDEPAARDPERESEDRALEAWQSQRAPDTGWRAPSFTGRPSLSSVLDARPSMHPSPPPPKSSPTSVLWWVVVSLLTSIIVAAGVIALREAGEAERAAAAMPAEANRPKVAALPKTEPTSPAAATQANAAPVPAPTEPTKPVVAPPVIAAVAAPTPAPAAAAPSKAVAAPPVLPAVLAPKPVVAAVAPAAKPVVAARPAPRRARPHGATGGAPAPLVAVGAPTESEKSGAEAPAEEPAAKAPPLAPEGDAPQEHLPTNPYL